MTTYCGGRVLLEKNDAGYYVLEKYVPETLYISNKKKGKARFMWTERERKKNRTGFIFDTKNNLRLGGGREIRTQKTELFWQLEVGEENERKGWGENKAMKED